MRSTPPAPEVSGATPSGSTANAVRLVAGIVVVVVLARAAGGLTTLVVIVALLSFVMLHELGHLVTAKWTGMKVTEYFVGFGPRLWSVRRGETEYGIKAIPAGGYVRIIGMNNLEEVAPADEARSYRQQSFPRRLLVVSAGSAVHFLIALVLLYILNTAVGVTNFNPPVLRIAAVDGLTTGASPAQEAGFRPGDVIVSADGHRFKDSDTMRRYIQDHPGVPVSFGVQRGPQTLVLTATPVDLTKARPKEIPGAAPVPVPTHPTGFLGVEQQRIKDRTDPFTAVGRSGAQFGHDAWLTIRAIGSIFSPHGIASIGGQIFTSANATDKAKAAAQSRGEPSPDAVRPVSAVGIVRLTGQAAKAGWEPVLTVLLAINIFVGVFNLIPLLPFDGGHVAIAAYERVRSRRGRQYHVDVARLLPLTYGVVLVLVFIFASSLYLDIIHPL